MNGLMDLLVFFGLAAAWVVCIVGGALLLHAISTRVDSAGLLGEMTVEGARRRTDRWTKGADEVVDYGPSPRSGLSAATWRIGAYTVSAEVSRWSTGSRGTREMIEVVVKTRGHVIAKKSVDTGPGETSLLRGFVRRAIEEHAEAA